MNDTNGTHLLYREPVRIRQQDQMLMGIRLQAHPTSQQKLVLSQWMGCARFIWNAKCDEDRYPGSYAHRYMPCGTYAPIGQKFSQYKDGQLSPWLSQCPSQIPRNSVVNWYQTYQKFLKGECGKPKRKKKSDGGSIHLTKEVFRFETWADGVTRLFIGTKTNNGFVFCLRGIKSCIYQFLAPLHEEEYDLKRGDCDPFELKSHEPN